MVSPKGASSSSSSRTRPNKTQTRAYLFELAVATALLSASAYMLMKRHEGGGGLRGGKAYTAFTPFYTQVYLKEHSSLTNRYLHFVGTTLVMLFSLTEPRLLAAAPLAIAVGVNVFYLTLGLKHGLLEFVALLSTFTLTARLLTGSYTKPLVVLGVGYAWAWVGHFLVEHNKPATLTYATWSLLGDFKMWYATLRQLIDTQ